MSSTHNKKWQWMSTIAFQLIECNMKHILDLLQYQQHLAVYSPVLKPPGPACMHCNSLFLSLQLWYTFSSMVSEPKNIYSCNVKLFTVFHQSIYYHRVGSCMHLSQITIQHSINFHNNWPICSNRQSTCIGNLILISSNRIAKNKNNQKQKQ